ncbi:MAG: hypothetical protein IPJ41_07230 [Phycisphaerales bacterium]|nr:hypothetical protein [Phycisphaerales bacterium]
MRSWSCSVWASAMHGERDIKEGARRRPATFEDDKFSFQQGNHDTGAKTILGSAATWTASDFVAAILDQPACSYTMRPEAVPFFAADLPEGVGSIRQRPMCCETCRP